MKKISLIGCVLFAMLFCVSCEKDDELLYGYAEQQKEIEEEQQRILEQQVRLQELAAVELQKGTVVDMGLSVMWATCNIGATKQEDYGNYYAWGEVETKSTYNWSTYKYGSDYDELTKYCTSSSYGTVDNKTTLEKSDDVAYTVLGGNWRMPTYAEWTELIENCTWEWTTINGVNGYKVSATNGNSIFLPAAGYRNDSELFNVGSSGYYWSSSLSADYPYRAWYVYFYSYYFSRSSGYRYYGQSVRPVLGL